MAAYNHIVDRNLVQWTSFGKFHNEPARQTLVKDLSDSHLMRIIEWITKHPSLYPPELLVFMKEEAKFRTENYIFVPDTY